MKVTTREIKFRDPNGRMVSSLVIGNGSLHDEVADYLDNSTAIEDAVASATGEWLTENITQPTTPVVDASLSVSGAAADSKKVGDEISDLKHDIDSMGGGGQPVPVTLASEMSDTEAIYLYLGEETGYTYGHVYAYIDEEWKDTGLYGRGQNGSDGADGFSPTVSITSTATGATISVTDKNGTTTASVSNGTATQAQVDAWLDAHPEATTTVGDGAITKVKLDSDLQNDVDIVNLIQNGFTIKKKVIGKGEILPIEFDVKYFPYTNSNGYEYMRFLNESKEIIKVAEGASLSAPFKAPQYPYNSDANYALAYSTSGSNLAYYRSFSVTDNIVTCYKNDGTQVSTLELASTPVYIQLGIAKLSGSPTFLWTVGEKYSYGTLSEDSVTVIPNDENLDGFYDALRNADVVSNGSITKAKFDSELITDIYGSAKYRFDYVNVQESDNVDINFSDYLYKNGLYVEGEKFDLSTGEPVVDATQNRSTLIPVIPLTQIKVGQLKTLVVFDLALNVIDSVTTAYAKVDYTIPENAAYIGMYGQSANFPRTTTSVHSTAVNKLVKVANKKADDLHVNWENVDNKDFYSELTQGEMSRLLSFKSIKTVNQMRHAFRVASFNTYIGNRNKWVELKEFLQSYGIDIIGFQEVHTPLSENSSGLTFEQALTSWHLSQFAIIETEDVPTNCRPVAATSEFEVVSIEETKYTQQGGWGNRHFTKTQLKLPRWKDKKASENFMVSVYNTQLEPGVTDNLLSIRLSQVNQLLAEVARDTNPFVIILGDFNEMATDLSTIQTIINAGYTPQLTDTSTPTAGRGFYDFIFVNDRIEIVGDDVIPYDLHNNISDHDLVFADVVFDYSNLISVKTSLPNCTLSGGTYWLDRRQTEPVVYTVTADSGYTISAISSGQGDNDLIYENDAVVIDGNTVTITPNLVVGDVWINVTTTANE